MNPIILSVMLGIAIPLFSFLISYFATWGRLKAIQQHTNYPRSGVVGTH